jgi:hypothetical protein
LLANAAASGGGALAAGNYWYLVTAVNEKGEGIPAQVAVNGVTANQQVAMDITAQGAVGTRFFNVYRTEPGQPAASAKFIGRLANTGAGAIEFVDLGNKKPGFVNAYLLEKGSAAMHELAPYSRLKLGIQDLSTPEAHFCFKTLAVYEPRKNVIVDNLKGTIK